MENTVSVMNKNKQIKEGFFSDFLRVYKQLKKTQQAKKLAKKDNQAKAKLQKMEKNVELINRLGTQFESDFEAVFGKKPKVTPKKVKLSDFF